MTPSDKNGAVGLGQRLKADTRRAAAAAVIGCGVFALAEFAVTVISAQGDVRAVTLLRFLILDFVLVTILALALVPLVVAAVVGLRLLVSLVAKERARRWPLFGDRGSFDKGQPPSAVVPWLWALLLSGGGFVAVSYVLVRTFIENFHGPKLIAIALAALHLVLVALCVPLAILLAAGFARLASALHRRLPRAVEFNPFGRVAPALFALLLAATGPTWVVLQALPQLKTVAPWRELLALVIFLLGTHVGARVVARRGGLWPLDKRRRRMAVAGVVAVVLVLSPLTLWKIGADPETKYLAISASPPLAHVVNLVRRANDFDGDGYGTLLGENDCAPFDAAINPDARDIADNGIDENCSGRDFSTQGTPSYRVGERMAVPDEYQRPWNFIFITVDTLRYDHTGFGGYKHRTNRDTTPHLDRLAKRAIQFDFCNAPSAGTMASIPSIMVSRFFHSGISLGPERRGQSPKILEDNVLLTEVMKRAGYRTGAILTHDYFNDWGLDQGVDYYDNSLGKKRDPHAITSAQVTDKALAWIARQGDKKWFLWAHYLDPHGRYVDHPGEKSFGKTEEDLYDGEIAFTDKHIGRLIDSLAHTSAGGRTVVIITSDHGDGFKEHGFINHGMALFREILHVPLLIYVPDGEAHRVEGPVSPMDVFPTVADMAGIDISDLSLEGQSLVPQIFYGRDAKDRIVFSETNWPTPLRAIVSNDHKLIYNMKANVYQLFDLRTDPWEKRNIWRKDPKAGQRLKDQLDEWLDRVYYSRDPKNQAQQKRVGILLDTKPKPKFVVDGGLANRVRVLGYDIETIDVKLGKPLRVTVFFETLGTIAADHKMRLSVLGNTKPRALVARHLKKPGGASFPMTRWRRGEFVRESFVIRLPATWQADQLTLSFEFLDAKNKALPVTGPAVPAGTAVIEMGTLAVKTSGPAPTPGRVMPRSPAIKRPMLRPKPTLRPRPPTRPKPRPKLPATKPKTAAGN